VQEPASLGGLGGLAVYGAAAIVLVALILVVSWLLGERHQERATGEQYESGIAPTGSARVHFGSRYYLAALLFVIFDLEAAFLFAWAVAARELGRSGLWAVTGFTLVLLVALAYEWRAGALDFGPRLRPGARRHDDG
jgi:NADH-quinone oxidoreductase subunit A